MPARDLPWRAFLLAPLAAPAGYTLAMLLLLLWRVVVADESPPAPVAFATVVGVIFIVGAPVAWGATLVAGIPAFLLLRSTGRLSRAAVLAGAAAIGVAAALALAPSLRGELFSIPLPWWLGALLGASTGEWFWRLLRPHAPVRPASGA